MTLDDYQTQAIRTRSSYYNEAPIQDAILLLSAAIAGEAGELLNKLKKRIERGQTINLIDVMDEGGDILWYLAALLDTAGINLESAALHNINKLRGRHGEKFNPDELNTRINPDKAI